MWRLAGVNPAMGSHGRDRHRVPLVAFAAGLPQYRLALGRLITQMDFDTAFVLVSGNVAFLAGEPGEIPGVEVAVDERHDDNAEVGDDEAGLFGSVGVLGNGQAPGPADAFERNSAADLVTCGFLSISDSWSRLSRTRRTPQS